MAENVKHIDFDWNKIDLDLDVEKIKKRRDKHKIEIMLKTLGVFYEVIKLNPDISVEEFHNRFLNGDYNQVYDRLFPNNIRAVFTGLNNEQSWQD